MSIPKKVHIVLKMVIPEDGEQYTTIIGVYAYKPDATKVIRKEMANWLYNNAHAILDAEADMAAHTGDEGQYNAIMQQKELTKTLLRAPMKSLKESMYGKSGKWSPRGKYWMRPRWVIDTQKLTPKSTKKSTKK